MRIVWFLFLICSSLRAVEIVSESPHVSCEELQINRDLKIYKDPTFFLPNLSLIYSDPRRGWESLFSENPVLTTYRGTAHFMRLGKPREFKNFGAVAKLYETVNPQFIAKKSKTEGEIAKHALIIPVKLCGSDSYSDTLGFVLETDLKLAQLPEETEDGQMRPSTLSNPVPVLKKNLN